VNISDLTLGLTRPQLAGTCPREDGAESLIDVPLSKKRAPDGFDLDDLEGPRVQTGTETLQSMAMDLLSEEGSGETARRYRHEAEAFTWTLFYICGLPREREGKIVTVAKTPFKDCRAKDWWPCLDEKLNLMDKVKVPGLAAHDYARPLLLGLCGLWYKRFRLGDSGNYGGADAAAPEFTFDGIEPSVRSYKESSDLRTFAMVVAVFGTMLGANTWQYNRVVELVKECKMLGIGSAQ